MKMDDKSRYPAWEKTKSDLKKTLAWALAVLCVIGVISYLATYGVSYRGWVAFTDSVNIENVTVAPKPHDCEWDSAPLGSKHCHYDSHEMRFDAKGNPGQPGNEGPNDKVVVVWEKVSE
jgi:hypothetical protein